MPPLSRIQRTASPSSVTPQGPLGASFANAEPINLRTVVVEATGDYESVTLPPEPSPTASESGVATPGEIAVLYRVNSQSEPYEAALGAGGSASRIACAMVSALGWVTWRPSAFFRGSLSYDFSDVELPFENGSFEVRLVRAGFDFAFSPTLSWVNLIQYDNVSEVAGINMRLHWIPQAGREVFHAKYFASVAAPLQTVNWLIRNMVGYLVFALIVVATAAVAFLNLRDEDAIAGEPAAFDGAPPDQPHLRWSRFENLEGAEAMYDVVSNEVFPFLRTRRPDAYASLLETIQQQVT